MKVVLTVTFFVLLGLASASAESYRPSTTLGFDGKPNGYIIRESDGANIPPDPKNADYQAYLAWVAAGNQPKSATAE